MFTKREEYLMRAVFDVADFYPDYDTWINERIQGSGLKRGDLISFDANAWVTDKLANQEET